MRTQNRARKSAAAAPGGEDRDSDVAALLAWPDGGAPREIRFRPARVMMDDTAGIPSLGDLAAMRDGGQAWRRSHNASRPRSRSISSSIIRSSPIMRGSDALARNMALEFKRNAERFAFLRWSRPHVREHARGAAGRRHLPSGQSRAPRARRGVQQDGAREIAYPDSMVGIDSHTPMINGLGIVGWESPAWKVAAALGEPVAMLIPQVIGCRLSRTAQRRRHGDRSRAR
jgi:aconitate hydratase